MIRVARTTTLAALRREAADAPALRREVRHLHQAIQTAYLVADAGRQRAAEEVREARAARDAAIAEAARGLSELKAAAAHPETGSTVRAALVLRIVRTWIADVRAAAGDSLPPASILIADYLLGEDAGQEASARCR
jgi:hypothetical protein